MFNVPNAFLCIEVKVIIRILSFTRFFKHTAIILNTIVYIYCIYILGVARYTDVTVRYVPRFGGHGLIRFRYNRKNKKQIYYSQFLLIYFEQTVVQIKKKFHLDVKILHIITLYIYKICFVFIVSVHK